jgi:hypothetical protein
MANLEVLSPPTPGKVIADTLVRALKTAVATFIGIMGVSASTSWNIDSAKAAALSAAAAGATVILNLILSWANSP